MKKILLSAAAVLMLFSCQNEATVATAPEASAGARRSCASQDVLAEQLAADPTLAIRMNQIEAYTQKAISTSNFRIVDGNIEIPVVVNVLYRTAAEDISLAQIQSQIDVLNEDFTASNSDITKLNSTVFAGMGANVGITFKLDTNVDTDGVIRKSTNKTSWGTRDAMKSSKQGGISPTTPASRLNIWVCTIGGGILGYAQFPGGKAATDGVVVDSRYFGLSGAANAPYNLGRTATHEVGHWMNLRHIWGDASCGNDFVADTPVHKTANYSNTAPFISLCLPTHYEMPMNYMDYTNDDLMYMFTNGQKDRMAALFLAGGVRAGFRLEP